MVGSCTMRAVLIRTRRVSTRSWYMNQETWNWMSWRRSCSRQPREVAVTWTQLWWRWTLARAVLGQIIRQAGWIAMVSHSSWRLTVVVWCEMQVPQLRSDRWPPVHRALKSNRHQTSHLVRWRRCRFLDLPPIFVILPDNYWWAVDNLASQEASLLMTHLSRRTQTFKLLYRSSSWFISILQIRTKCSREKTKTRKWSLATKSTKCVTRNKIICTLWHNSWRTRFVREINLRS